MTNQLVERNESAPVVQARIKAQIDWATVGEFNSSQYTGDAKKAYNEAAAQIEQQWENTGE